MPTVLCVCLLLLFILLLFLICHYKKMKVEGVGDIYKAFKSVGKVVNHSVKYGSDIIRRYAVPKLRNSNIIDTVDNIHAITKEAWKNLTDEEKDYWNNLASEGYLTGFQLFEQESWKTSVNSRLNLCKLGTARLCGSIRSGKGAVCGLTRLGVGYANGDRT